MNPEGESCFHGDKNYPPGSEVCTNDVCMLCSEGKFGIPPELSTNEDVMLVDPGEAYLKQGM